MELIGEKFSNSNCSCLLLIFCFSNSFAPILTFSSIYNYLNKRTWFYRLNQCIIATIQIVKPIKKREIVAYWFKNRFCKQGIFFTEWVVVLTRLISGTQYSYHKASENRRGYHLLGYFPRDMLGWLRTHP